MHLSNRDLIIAGVPRSGTTLTCSLLNKTANAVALHEPMEPSRLVGLSDADYLRRVQAFFHAQRAKILETGTATSKASGGKVPDNPYGARGADGSRAKHIDGREVHVDRERLDLDFYLAIKHPNCFSAMLAVLKTRFPCYAIVRNPLASLLSWRSLDLNVSRGHAPYAEAFAPALAATLVREADVTARQLILLDWYFAQYQRHLPNDHVIRYEDIVASGGRALAAIVPAAAALDEPLASRNLNRDYGLMEIAALAERLLARDGAWKTLYPATEIERLVETARSNVMAVTEVAR